MSFLGILGIMFFFLEICFSYVGRLVTFDGKDPTYQKSDFFEKKTFFKTKK